MTFSVVINDERCIESAFVLRMENGTATIMQNGKEEEVDVDSLLVLSDAEEEGSWWPGE